MNEDGIMLYLKKRKGGKKRMQLGPENEQIPNTVFLAAGLLFTPDFLCLACQRGNYGASLRPRCEGVSRSLSNCPPELQTSSWISQICSRPKMHDKLLKWSGQPNSKCHPGQHQDSIAVFHLIPSGFSLEFSFLVFDRSEISKGPSDIKYESVLYSKWEGWTHTYTGKAYVHWKRSNQISVHSLQIIVFMKWRGRPLMKRRIAQSAFQL